MVEAADMKHWRDAGHVARRTLEAMKDEIKDNMYIPNTVNNKPSKIANHLKFGLTFVVRIN